MSLHKPRDCGQDDAQTQGAVLALILAEHPAQLIVSELARELIEDPNDFAERDALERGVRDLASVGLLHRQCGFVLPSRAGLYFGQLDSGAGSDYLRDGEEPWLGE